MGAARGTRSPTLDPCANLAVGKGEPVGAIPLSQHLLAFHRASSAVAELHSVLQPFIRAKAKRKVTWLRPEIVAEVVYSNVTAGGMLRHGMLKGLRYDLA